jgi:hypothetical protein
MPDLMPYRMASTRDARPDGVDTRRPAGRRRHATPCRTASTRDALPDGVDTRYPKLVVSGGYDPGWEVR